MFAFRCEIWIGQLAGTGPRDRVLNRPLDYLYGNANSTRVSGLAFCRRICVIECDKFEILLKSGDYCGERYMSTPEPVHSCGNSITWVGYQQALNSSTGEDEDNQFDYGPTVSRSTAHWIEDHLLNEPVCTTCKHPQPELSQDNSLDRVTAFLRDSGLPDILHQTVSTPVPPPADPLWKNILTGSPNRPNLQLYQSNLHDERPLRRFDIDAFIAEARSFQALKGFRFSYYPRPMQNLHQPIHISFHGRALHQCRHIRFTEGLHDQHLWVYIAFSRMPCSRETYLSEEQHALWG